MYPVPGLCGSSERRAVGCDERRGKQGTLFKDTGGSVCLKPLLQHSLGLAVGR